MIYKAALLLGLIGMVGCSEKAPSIPYYETKQEQYDRWARAGETQRTYVREHSCVLVLMIPEKSELNEDDMQIVFTPPLATYSCPGIDRQVSVWMPRKGAK